MQKKKNLTLKIGYSVAEHTQRIVAVWFAHISYMLTYMFTRVHDHMHSFRQYSLHVTV